MIGRALLAITRWHRRRSCPGHEWIHSTAGGRWRLVCLHCPAASAGIDIGTAPARQPAAVKTGVRSPADIKREAAKMMRRKKAEPKTEVLRFPRQA